MVYGLSMGIIGGSAGKESAFIAGDLSSIPELGKSPRVGNGNPLFPEESHRQRNLVGYSLLLLLLSHFSRVRLCATPWTAAHQAPPSMGVQRIGHD